MQSAWIMQKLKTPVLKLNLPMWRENIQHKTDSNQVQALEDTEIHEKDVWHLLSEISLS